MAARRCARCSRFLSKPVGRGRPPLSCGGCRAKVQVVSVRTCRDCDVLLPAPVGRGRPAVKCSDCRTPVLVNA